MPSPSRYLDQAVGCANDLKKRITELWNYPKVGTPFIEGGRIFYRKNSGLQKQSPLFVRTSLDASPTLVIDPNQLWPDGNTSLSGTGPSPDASLLAYMTSEGGADWQTVHVRNLSTRPGSERPDQVDALLRTLRGRKTRRVSSIRAIRSRPPARFSKPRCQARRSTTTASARRSPTIG